MTTPAQTVIPNVIGWEPAAPASSSVTLNGAASGGFSSTWLALGFVPDHSATINAFRVFLSVVTGTLGANDLVLDIYSDNGSGTPSTSLGSVTLGSVPAGGTWITFSGLSIALTAGTQYWAVLRNANASPTVNNPAYGLPQGVLAGSLLAASPSWMTVRSTNSGSTWGISAFGIGGYRIAYSDGTYAGFPVKQISQSSDKVFGGTASGVKFTTPPNGALQLRAIGFAVRPKNGTPAGSFYFAIFPDSAANVSSPLAQTNAITNTPSAGLNWYVGYLSNTLTLQPNTTYRVVMLDSSGSDSSSNYFSMNEATFDSDSCAGGTVNLMPLEGTAEKTYFNGTSWVDTATSLFPFALLLDSNKEFGVSGGGMILRSPIIQGA